MPYAIVHMEQADGTIKDFEMENDSQLSHALNYIQGLIFDGYIVKAEVTPIDLEAEYKAQAFNALAGSLPKLKDTSKMIRGVE